MGDEQLYRRLLRMFRDRESAFAVRFRAARQAGDIDEATRLVHDLKSVSGSLGAEAVCEAAQALELDCVAGAEGTAWEPLLATLAERLDPVIAGLRALRDPG
jgi:HPt (histidine-containing phosphotransfer) domain-containing protein